MTFDVAFNVRVLVHGCSSVPHHANARVYCKWKLLTSQSVAGILPHGEITEGNAVEWEAVIEVTPCVFKMNMDTMQLRPVLQLSVRQDERVGVQGAMRLGVVCVDLAEFAGQGETDRTYLLEHSRLNSTLSVTVITTQVSRDIMFRKRVPRCALLSTNDESDSDSPVRRASLLRFIRRPSSSSPLTASVKSPESSISASHTVYQVVGDILRISEENRSARAAMGTSTEAAAKPTIHQSIRELYSIDSSSMKSTTPFDATESDRSWRLPVREANERAGAG